MARVPTFVDGLDEFLGGGVPEGHVVLVQGPPGSMKTTLTYSVLLSNAAREKHRGLYLCLEQSRARFLAQMEQTGLPPGPGGDLLEVVDLAGARRETPDQAWGEVWLEVLGGLIDDAAGRETKLAALDSLTLHEALAGQVKRSQVMELFEKFREAGLTAFVISEGSGDGLHPAGADFLADGILQVRIADESGGVQRSRRIAVRKMRGVAHGLDDLTLLFRNGKFRVAPVMKLG